MSKCYTELNGESLYKSEVVYPKGDLSYLDINLNCVLDPTFCEKFLSEKAKVHTLVQPYFGGNLENLQKITINSDIIYHGFQVGGLSVGSGGVNGSIEVTSDTVSYEGEFSGSEIRRTRLPSFETSQITGSSLRLNSVELITNVVFRINGQDRRLTSDLTRKFDRVLKA